MTNREQVYQAIDTERKYQDALGANRTAGEDHTVGDYVTMMQYYQNALIEAWTTTAGDDAALDIMRKIAGIAVHCMEDHGAPKRK